MHPDFFAPTTRTLKAARVSVAAILGTRVRLILHVSVKSEDEMRRAAARGLGE